MSDSIFTEEQLNELCAKYKITAGTFFVAAFTGFDQKEVALIGQASAVGDATKLMQDAIANGQIVHPELAQICCANDTGMGGVSVQTFSLRALLRSPTGR